MKKLKELMNVLHVEGLLIGDTYQVLEMDKLLLI